MRNDPNLLIFRHLPAQYRRAGKSTAAYSLTQTLGRMVGQIDRLSGRILRSRFLTHLRDMEDLERLSALFELSPWPEESLESYRHRVRLMSRIYLKESISAGDMLQIVAAANNADLTEVLWPGNPERPRSTSSNDRFTTMGRFKHLVDPYDTFTAAIIDAPPVFLKTLPIGPNSGYQWYVENRFYWEPGPMLSDGTILPDTYPDPVLHITAGKHPVALPILVQRNLRRLVLVNRFIPPGATLYVDLIRHRVIDIAGPASLQGPVTIDGAPAPDLLYGTGGLIGDIFAQELSGPTTPPFHLLQWSPAIQRGYHLPQVPGPAGSTEPVPTDAIPWPSLLGLGPSRWRLLIGTNRFGYVPLPDETLPLHELRPAACTPENGPAEMLFRWGVRRPGSFTLLVYDEENDQWLPPNRLRHLDWLNDQIHRLKLAGVVYVDPRESMLVQSAIAQPDLDHRSLWESLSLGDSLAVSISKKEGSP